LFLQACLSIPASKSFHSQWPCFWKEMLIYNVSAETLFTNDNAECSSADFADAKAKRSLGYVVFFMLHHQKAFIVSIY